MNAGRFITFEGGEGAGKSTQIKLLAEALAARGIPHLVTREPGGTTGAESIRRLLVEQGETWEPMTETVLFLAARVDHVRKKILPALRAGEWVLCDRFADSTAVYQGIGKGISREFLDMAHRLILGDFQPDLTLILDLPTEEGLKRAGARGGKENRFEALGLEFHRCIRQGFLAIAQAQPERCAVIDAAQPPEAVHAAILRALDRLA